MTKERSKLEVKIRQLEQQSTNNSGNEEKIRKMEEEHKEVLE